MANQEQAAFSVASRSEGRPVCVIFGGGHGGHVGAALLAHRRPDLEVRVLTRTADQWNARLRESGRGVACIDLQDGTSIYGRPALVGSDPAAVLPVARYLIFVGYQNDHEKFLRQAAPYVKPGTVIGAFNCGCGFKCLCRHLVGDEIFSRVVFFATSTLPWACRANACRGEATIHGKKEYIVAAVTPESAEQDVAAFLDSLFCKRPSLEMNNFLALEFMNPGSILHPVIMRGVVRRHADALPWESEPRFYTEVDDRTAAEISALSREYLILRDVLTERFRIDLSSLVHIRDWLVRSYPDELVDRTSFKSMLNSNRPYQVCMLPCIQRDDGRYRPDYRHRYVLEEIPCGSVAIKGIAALAGVPTPELDALIEWGQSVLGKEYLVGGELKGRDLGETRAPQRFGISSIEAFMSIYMDQSDPI